MIGSSQANAKSGSWPFGIWFEVVRSSHLGSEKLLLCDVKKNPLLTDVSYSGDIFANARRVAMSEPGTEGTPNSLPPDTPHAVASLYRWIVGASIFVAALVALFTNLGQLTQILSSIFSGPSPIIIEQPTQNKEVGASFIVTGTSPYQTIDHYVAITPSTTGRTFIQSGAFRPSQNRHWQHYVNFGEKSSCEVKFSVQIFATNQNVDGGTIPKGAQLSDPVIVHREPCLPP
jgi:hypothetical protein